MRLKPSRLPYHTAWVLSFQIWLATNIQFLQAVLADPQFLAGEVATDFIVWDGSGLAPEDLQYGSSFVGVGSCQATTGIEGGTLDVVLACTLNGTRDDQAFEDEAIEITLPLQLSGVPALPDVGATVSARFVVSSPGLAQGSDRYFVLEQPMLPTDGNAPILFASRGFSLEPAVSVYAAWFEGDWFGGPAITSADASCTTGEAPQCTEDIAVSAGWLDAFPIDVHGSQMGTFGAPTEGGTYDLYVDAAWNAPDETQCPIDFGGSNFELVAVGATPQ